MLSKLTIIDKIEILESGVVQVRTANRIVEDGAVLSQSYHRHCISPVDDYSGEDAKVQTICAATFTPEVIAAYQAALNATNLPSP